LPLLLALVAVIIGGVWWWQRPPPEPVYNGQPLSKWMARLSSVNDLAAVDLHAFGPGTVPWLAYTAEHGKHPFAGRVPFHLDKAPDWLRRWLPEKWRGLRPSSARDERIYALMILERLGPEAAPAIPTLARILERASHGDDFQFPWQVARALNTTGPASWPVVEQILERGNDRARLAILGTIFCRVGPVENPASEAEVARVVAVVHKGRTGPDPAVRAAAAASLSFCCDNRPELFALDSLIDEVIRCLSDSEWQERMRAVDILAQGTTGAKGARAIPRLIELLEDRNHNVGMGAARALGRLDTVEKLSAARLRALLRALVRDGLEPAFQQTVEDALRALGLSPDDEGTSREPVLAR
jgi:hypothetical protein